jgi:hypothetical protein
VDHIAEQLKFVSLLPGPGGDAMRTFLAPLHRTVEPRRRGRRRLPDDVLLRAAVAYVAAVERHSEQPVLDAAKQIGETPERVRDLLHRARVRGLLMKTISGRAGGGLTPDALAIVNQGKARPKTVKRKTPSRRPRRKRR